MQPVGYTPLQPRGAPLPWIGRFEVKAESFNKQTQAWESGTVTGSGALVASPNNDIVATAAHVVCSSKDSKLDLSTLTFTPGYVGGVTTQPGAIPVARIAAPQSYLTGQPVAPDLAFVRLRSASGVQGMPISWNNADVSLWQDGVTLYGYPAASTPPGQLYQQRQPIGAYDEEDGGGRMIDTLNFTTDPSRLIRQNAGLVTQFTEGASGGPVLASPAEDGSGEIMGVITSEIGGRANDIAVYMPNAINVYTAARAPNSMTAEGVEAAIELFAVIGL